MKTRLRRAPWATLGGRWRGPRHPGHSLVMTNLPSTGRISISRDFRGQALKLRATPNASLHVTYVGRRFKKTVRCPGDGGVLTGGGATVVRTPDCGKRHRPEDQTSPKKGSRFITHSPTTGWSGAAGLARNGGP